MKINAVLRREAEAFFQLKQTERLWHIPLLAALCTGLPLLAGYFIGRLDYGLVACLGGLVILYLPATALEHRMITLLVCSFGLVLSFAAGIVCSFNSYFSAIMVGLLATGISWLSNYFRLPPPGNFFFIMLASMASCMPFDLYTIPTKIGLLAIGTMVAILLALPYSVYITRKLPVKAVPNQARKRYFTNLSESLLIGLFISLSLVIGHLLRLANPYWVPISCLAVMQGMNVVQVGQRSFHRIFGTFTGMGLTWLLLEWNPGALAICLAIMVLQFIIEMLVVRHYALAVIFITPMTFFLAEMGRGMQAPPSQLIKARLLDIVIGSLVGLIGGMLLHNKKLHQRTGRQIRKTRIALMR